MLEVEVSEPCPMTVMGHGKIGVDAEESVQESGGNCYK